MIYKLLDQNMVGNTARRLTQKELEQGYIVCGCGKFAYIFRAAVGAALPADYYGEWCPQCGLWMVAVDKLPPGKGEGEEMTEET